MRINFFAIGKVFSIHLLNGLKCLAKKARASDVNKHQERGSSESYFS